MDAIKYLEENPCCGIVQLTGYLGGAKAGRSVRPFFDGFYETACGLVLRGPRNRVYEHLIDPRLNVIGGGSDPATCVTSLINGFYLAKAYNMPVRKDPSKKIFVPAGRSEVNLSDNPNYNSDYLTKTGVHARITELFGEYRHGKRISKSLYDTYRRAAIQRGNIILEPR